MNRETGFTLIELVMIMVILGLISVYAVPRFTMGIFDARSAAQEFVEAIRYAQEMSMAHSGDMDYGITFTTTGYTVSKGGAPVPDPLTSGSSYASSWSGITLSQGGVISFNSRGVPTCSGGLAACSAVSNSNVTVNAVAGGESVTVTIERYTGYARAE
jgi:type II secretory pathway pseudopilin PulG